jgi:hypothetical protein
MLETSMATPSTLKELVEIHMIEAKDLLPLIYSIPNFSTIKTIGSASREFRWDTPSGNEQKKSSSTLTLVGVEEWAKPSYTLLDLDVGPSLSVRFTVAHHEVQKLLISNSKK